MKVLEEAREALIKECAKLMQVVNLIDQLNGVHVAKAMAVAAMKTMAQPAAKKHFSAAAREKMRLAQQKRWALWRKQHGKKA